MLTILKALHRLASGTAHDSLLAGEPPTIHRETGANGIFKNGKRAILELEEQTIGELVYYF